MKETKVGVSMELFHDEHGAYLLVESDFTDSEGGQFEVKKVYVD